MNIRIFSVFHKPYWMPSDSLYCPIQVGSAASIINPFDKRPILRDDTCDNISSKNKNYCELTALYWIWKNVDFSDFEYIGLDHYRRHFAVSRFGNKKRRVITGKQIDSLLFSHSVDIILPKKRHYWIETNYSQYAHAHHVEDLNVTRDAISEFCPDYLSAFDSEMSKTSGHRFNMFIMKSEILKSYCEWLFPLLDYVEKNLDVSGYNEYDARVYGFISERLLDVWMAGNNFKAKEINYVFEDKVNWIKKINGFLLRKIGIKKDVR